MPGFMPGIPVFLLAVPEERRGWCGEGRPLRVNSGIKPRLGPWLIQRIAAEFDAVVQTERAVVPEFEPQWRDAPAAPARRARPLADNVPGGDLGDRLLKGKAAFQRLRLLAGPGADLGLL